MTARRSARGLAILLVNGGLIVAILYGFEGWLRFSDPRRHLPLDDDRDGVRITWGHQVVTNRFGFREREFAVAKPENTIRIMVLGDSLTWGVGLDVSERYTNLLETSLTATHPRRSIEVLNFGMPGAPTTLERDIARRFIPLIDPDLIVVGFCLNDPQPKSQAWSLERDAYERRIGARLAFRTSHLLGRLRLARLSELTSNAVYRVAEWTAAIPSWQTALQRTYEPTSPEWRAFENALADIKALSDAQALPTPLFIVLNQGMHRDGTDYGHPDKELAMFLRWYRQAEAAARNVGFITVDVERELAEQLPRESLWVNAVDGHPSARANQIYARKLVEIVSRALTPRLH